MANLDAETRAIIREIGCAMAEDASTNGETRPVRVDVTVATGDSRTRYMGSVACLLFSLPDAWRQRNAS